MKIYKSIMAVMAIAVLSVSCGEKEQGGNNGGDPTEGELCINEVYYSNPDWIELYNGTDAEIDLSGYVIQDDKGEAEQFVVPAGTKIAAGGFLVFDENTGTEPDPTRFPFGISSGSGDQLTLFDPAGKVVDDVILPMVLPTDVPTSSFGRTTDGGTPWKRFEHPTKGVSNTTEVIIPIGDYTGLVINEVDGNNKFVELYNKGGNLIDLEGVVLIKDGKDIWWIGLAGKSIAAGGRYTIVQEGEENDNNGNADEFSGTKGISPKKTVKFELKNPAKDTVLDSFERTAAGLDLGDDCAPDYGKTDPAYSFSRCPDGTGDFGLAVPSCAAANPATSAGAIATDPIPVE